MLAESNATTAVWPLAVYFGLTVLLAGGMLGLSYVLGQRHKQRATGQPYECGILPTRAKRLRLGVDFYLLALFFMIFDLEAMFFFTWAMVVRQVGWAGYVEVVIFAGVLLAGLAYLWRQGAWTGAPSRRRKKKQASRRGRRDRRGRKEEEKEEANSRRGEALGEAGGHT